MHTYLESLLQGAKVEWKALGEIAKPLRGKRVVRAELDEAGQYPVYQNSLQPLGFYTETNCQGYTTFIIAAGAAGSVGFSNIDFWGLMIVIISNALKKFLMINFFTIFY